MLKEQEKLIKIRGAPEARLMECKSCSNPNFISNPTIEVLL